MKAALALVAVLVFVSTADARHERAWSQKQLLRIAVGKHRSTTWRLQDKAGVPRWPTAHKERHASFHYLHQLVRLWKERSREARQSYQRTRLPSGLDSCLRTLIVREGSRWDPHATNPSTGAYGLPQALPGSKMASAGADWADNPATQIRWMIGYVNSRYGGSCAALSHSYSYGWY